MLHGLGRRLGLTAERIEQPPGTAPSLILERIGDQWFIAMLHGGKIIHRYDAKQARRMANRFIEFAWLASNPGSCPTGEFE